MQGQSETSTDPRVLIENELAQRIKRNARYSMRSFAKTIGISHSLLSLVLSGKRRVSKKTLRRIEEKLGLSPEPAETPAETNEGQQLSLDAFSLLADWYHYAILSLLELPEARLDSHWIAKRLGITPLEARLAVSRLKRMQLIAKIDGRWKQSSRPLKVENRQSTSATRKHHRQILEKAQESLENDPFEKRDLILDDFRHGSQRSPLRAGKNQTVSKEARERSRANGKTERGLSPCGPDLSGQSEWRSRKMRQVWFIALSICLLSQAAFAGNESGHGGYGIRIGKRIDSLDLAEGGVSEQPYTSLDNADVLPPELAKKVKRVLGRVASDNVFNILNHKFAHLHRVLREGKIAYPLYLMLEHMSEYTWIRHDNLACLDVEDDSSPYRHKVQIAYRQGSFIRFCQDYNTLNDPNQAAVVAHEIIYASLKEKATTVELVGFLFSRDLKTQDDVSYAALKRALPYVFASDWQLIDIAKVNSIAPEILRDNPPPPGTKLCFGSNAPLLKKPGFTIWTLDKPYDEDCTAGLQYRPADHFITYLGWMPIEKTSWPFWRGGASRPNWFDQDSGEIHLNDDLIGYVNLNSGELSHFCSGEIECRLDYSPLFPRQDEAKHAHEENVLEVWQIREGITQDLNVPKGYGACFGVLRKENNTHFALWAAKLGTTCAVGKVQSNYWLLFRGDGHLLGVEPPSPPTLSDVIIGDYSITSDSQPILEALCSGHYKSVCTADLTNSTFSGAPAKSK